MPAGVRARATVLSTVSATTFGMSGPLAKSVLLLGWSAPAVTTARVLLAAVLVTGGVAIVRPRSLRFSRRDVGLFVGYGLLGVAGAQLCFFLAVARIPVSAAMLLEFLAPVLVALWIRVVRRTRLRIGVWAGIVLALFGLSLVAEVWQGLRLDPLGVAAGLGSAVSAAGYFLLGEHGASGENTGGMTAAGLLIGAVLVSFVCPPWMLPLHLLDAPTTLAGWHPPAWLVLIMLTVLATVVPYLTGIIALRHLPPTAASTLGLIEPTIATVAAWLLLGQTLRPVQLLGGAAILGGAAVVQVGSASRTKQAPPLTCPT